MEVLSGQSHSSASEIVKKSKKSGGFFKRFLGRFYKEKVADNDLREEELEELLCPICCELFYDPHAIQPCSHIFCGLCLRHLASLHPNNSLCPICRQRIISCVPKQEIVAEIENICPLEFSRRKSEALKNPYRLKDLPFSSPARVEEPRLIYEFAQIFQTAQNTMEHLQAGATNNDEETASLPKILGFFFGLAFIYLCLRLVFTLLSTLISSVWRLVKYAFIASSINIDDHGPTNSAWLIVYTSYFIVFTKCNLQFPIAMLCLAGLFLLEIII